MIGLAPSIAASRVAVPEVTTEYVEIDKKSLAESKLILTGNDFGTRLLIVSKILWSDAGIK